MATVKLSTHACKNSSTKQSNTPQLPGVEFQLEASRKGTSSTVDLIVRGLKEGQSLRISYQLCYTSTDTICTEEYKAFGNWVITSGDTRKPIGSYHYKSSKEDTYMGYGIEVELKCEMDNDFTSYIPPTKRQVHDDCVGGNVELFNNWARQHYDLMGDENLKDCQLIAGAETIKAHKSILARFSPVFREFFTNPGAQEAVDGVVHVNGFPIGAIRAMVDYIYSGHITSEALDNHAKELFQLSAKYQLLAMKQYLEHYLSTIACVENVIQLAKLAFAHDSPLLMETCTDLFIANHTAIGATPEWSVLKSENPAVCIELLEAMNGM